MEARKPTILGPHGEGYCRACRFVVGLGPDGLLEGHTRGKGLAHPIACPGGDRRPAKVTPYASRKAAFRVNVPMGVCLRCVRTVEVEPDGRLIVHRVHPWDVEQCKGGRGWPFGYVPPAA